MDNSLIIHLGGPKTGTSALQAFLAKNRAALLAKGLDYPALEDLAPAELGGISSGNGVGVALHFLEPGKHDAKNAYPRFIEVLNSKSARSVLLSSEYFAYLRGEDFTRCRAAAASTGRKLRLILYVRPQIPSIISTYAQRIKRHCEIATIEEFWNTNRKNFDYLPRIRAFEAAVGKENLIVRPYLRHQFVGGDVINDFGSLIGMNFREAAFTHFPHEINPTPNLHELALLRYLNGFKKVDYESGISDSLLSVIKDARGEVKEKNRLWLSDALSEKIVLHYQEANKELASRYLGGQAFEADMDKPSQTVFMDELADPDPMVMAMAKLYLSMFRALHRQQQTINSLLHPKGNA